MASSFWHPHAFSCPLRLSRSGQATFIDQSSMASSLRFLYPVDVCCRSARELLADDQSATARLNAANQHLRHWRKPSRPLTSCVHACVACTNIFLVSKLSSPWESRVKLITRPQKKYGGTLDSAAAGSTTMRLLGHRIVLNLFLLFLTRVVYCGVEDWLFPTPAARIYTTEQNGSYFGYSVASYEGQSKPFCLVGAPNARKNFEGLFEPPDPRKAASLIEQIHGKSTGSVYRLDLDPSFPDCDVMPIASNNEDRRQHGTLEPGVSLWIGGLVAATSSGNDGLQLGCDPRYLYTPSLSNNSLPGIGMQNMGTGTCALYTGPEAGEAFVVLGMPGSYLTEGNVFFGHYKGRQTITSVRLKSSPQDLKHRGFNLGYAVGMHKRPFWRQKMSPRFTILASSPMWIENNYMGIVMVLTEALNIESLSERRPVEGSMALLQRERDSQKSYTGQFISVGCGYGSLGDVGMGWFAGEVFAKAVKA
ncbi:unnamed protein product [Schistocephalus solidus]|uniref:FAD-binding PCMH-type domain-containing protein n=1 Tax=Schistocephalus solidus TaxID=70667 RepID=A0A183T8M9_SCHSO|nr:unnamed protein product [Schistocephalus solidus]